MKRITSLLLALLLAISTLNGVPVSAFADTDAATEGTCGANAVWEYDENTKTLEIGGFGAMDNFTRTNMPWAAFKEEVTTLTIGEGITTLGEYSFYGFTALASVSMPDTLTEMGYCVFSNCSSLNEIILPESLEKMDYGCFRDCTALVNIVIPDSVKELSGWVFSGCKKLKNATLPSGLTILHDGMFKNCESLIEIILPSGLTMIKSQVFNGCNSLTEVIIPEGVTAIGDEAFCDCSSIKSIKIPNGVKSIGNNAFNNCVKLTSIDIPDSVTSIGVKAFFGCRELESLSIPSSVMNIAEGAIQGYTGEINFTLPNTITSISANAFAGCSGLKEIIIPDSVTTIGSSAFSNCSSLTSITIPDSVTTIGNSAFFGCENLAAISLPESLTSIGEQSFQNCVSLTNISIPKNVNNIGSYLFHGCSNLTSITIPDSVTTIGNSAFFGCENLAAISLPESLTSIGEQSFQNCVSLTNISIPKNVNNIGDSAFTGCVSLQNINVVRDNSVYMSENGVLFNNNMTTLIRYPQSKTETEYSIPDSVTSIDTSAFRGCSNLKGVTIPDSVTSIGRAAFSYCSGLTSVTIPDSVSDLGIWQFYACSNLKTLFIGKSVERVGDYTFCDSLVEIYILNKTCAIDTHVKSATIFGYPNSTAQKYAETYKRPFIPLCYDGTPNHNFKISEPFCLNDGCGIENPNYIVENNGTCGDGVKWNYDDETYTLTVYGEGAMDDTQPWSAFAPYVKYVEIENGVTSIGNGSFKNCNNIVKVTIPDSVTSIGDNAFEGCPWLRSIAIPSSVTSIGNDLFSGCRRLTLIEFSGTKAQWNAYAESAINTDEIKKAVVYCVDGAIYDESLYVVENGAIYTIDKKKLIKIITVNKDKEFNVPEGVEVISEGTCENTEVEIVNCPDSITEIEKDALKGEELETVNLSDGITTIDENAMADETLAIVYNNSVTHKALLNNNHPNIVSIELGSASNNVTTKNGAKALFRPLLSSGVTTTSITSDVFSYTGSEIKPAVIIRKNGKTLSNTKYNDKYSDKKYKNNIYAGKATIYVALKGIARSGNPGRDITFHIYYNSGNLKATLSKNNYTYNGKAPTVTVKTPNGKTVPASQYSVSGFSSAVGKHTVTVTTKTNQRGKGVSFPMNGGKITLTYTVKPKATKIKRLKKGKSAITVKWKKQTKQVDGYQIQYSTNKSFKGAETVKVTGAKKASKTIKGLKGKKKYYVRIQTFKKAGGVYYFSDWSKAKSVTTKK